MKIAFTEPAWEDYLWFQEHDRKLLKRINILIRDAARSAFDEIGKPEPLKAELAGCWSRRINEEHRLVYMATAGELTVIACRYHYGS